MTTLTNMHLITAKKISEPTKRKTRNLLLRQEMLSSTPLFVRTIFLEWKTWDPNLVQGKNKYLTIKKQGY